MAKLNMTKLTTVPAQLAVPNDLDFSARVHIAKVVNVLLADIFALFVKTKNFHWHMSGRYYQEFHLLFDEQAAELYAMIDVFAERLRKLGFITIRSIGEIARLQTLNDNNQDFVTPQAMIEELLNDNKMLIKNMRSVHKICSEGNDLGTTSLIENYIDEGEKRVWVLFETQVQ